MRDIWFGELSGYDKTAPDKGFRFAEGQAKQLHVKLKKDFVKYQIWSVSV
jgi:hypothetical protein